MRCRPYALSWLLGTLLLASPAAGAARGGKSTGTGFREIERQLRESYQRTHPCPATGRTTGNCPGYVVGYILLPKFGGTYQQSNMRWMTEEEAEKSGQDRRW
jgi:hypothetical protein